MMLGHTYPFSGTNFVLKAKEDSKPDYSWGSNEKVVGSGCVSDLPVWIKVRRKSFK
jgi:hypothetical protein